MRQAEAVTCATRALDEAKRRVTEPAPAKVVEP